MALGQTPAPGGRQSSRGSSCFRTCQIKKREIKRLYGFPLAVATQDFGSRLKLGLLLCLRLSCAFWETGWAALQEWWGVQKPKLETKRNVPEAAGQQDQNEGLFRLVWSTRVGERAKKNLQDSRARVLSILITKKRDRVIC